MLSEYMYFYGCIQDYKAKPAQKTDFLPLIMTSSKPMSCKLEATGPNIWNVTDDGIVYYRTKFCGIQIRGFWDTSFWNLEISIYIVWQNGLEYISCTPTWLPPYKPQEILQSLNGHNIDILKSIDLNFWENI